MKQSVLTKLLYDSYISGVAKLRVFELWIRLFELSKNLYICLYFFFYCKLQKYCKMVLW